MANITIIQETAIKTTMNYHTSRLAIIEKRKKKRKITSAGEDMEGPELSYIAIGNMKMVQPLRETVWQFLNKLHTELPYDPAIPPPDTHPKELKTGTQKPVHKCSQQHYSQQQKGGNPNVYQAMSG